MLARWSSLRRSAARAPVDRGCSGAEQPLHVLDVARRPGRYGWRRAAPAPERKLHPCRRRGRRLSLRQPPAALRLTRSGRRAAVPSEGDGRAGAASSRSPDSSEATWLGRASTTPIIGDRCFMRVPSGPDGFHVTRSSYNLASTRGRLARCWRQLCSSRKIRIYDKGYAVVLTGQPDGFDNRSAALVGDSGSNEFRRRYSSDQSLLVQHRLKSSAHFSGMLRISARKELPASSGSSPIRVPQRHRLL